ncbi:MAG: extradiol dioxygenase [Bacteroidetes bacterium]|nr:extradiol dioxygenase [Bacteroidota bacterium]MBS1932381.1 extradiol dioxygenase [Bacteroidota bacterium]
MTKELWLNLPVKNVKASKTFFTNLGFSFNPRFGDSDENVCLMIGEKNIAVMLFAEQMFKHIIRNEIADTKSGNEMIISFDVSSKEEVDEIAKKAEEAGGTVFGKPSEIQGWMYGCGFTDLDGHRWNALYMDMNKMQNK